MISNQPGQVLQTTPPAMTRLVGLAVHSKPWRPTNKGRLKVDVVPQVFKFHCLFENLPKQKIMVSDCRCGFDWD